MKPRRKRVKAVPLPPLPATVFSIHGPVPVVLTDDPKILDPGDFGAWNAHDRVIYIRCGMHPTASWLTLFHEQCHSDLSDIDFAIEHTTLEAVCNCIAAARLAALRAGATLP
jgi:hypothetical protein